MKNIRGAQTSEFTIPAGTRKDVMTEGEFIRCLSSTAPFSLSVSGGSEMFFDGGIEYETASLETYEGFSIVNNSGVSITVVMAWGFGGFKDSRLSVNKTLNVVDAANLAKLEETRW